MENLFSYLKWRGDLSFNESPFNEVDNVILCAFSYIRIEKCILKNDKISIENLYQKYKELEIEDHLFLKNQNQLFSLLSISKRFKDILVAQFVNEISEEEEKQFCAMTFILNDQELFIGFRGTDSTLVGWKENLNLSYLKNTPSQKRAVEYLEEVLKHTNKKVIVGGHSKGGNLAMYSYVFCDAFLRKKIMLVYNNDGPGLEDNSKDLKEIEQNIITFIPRASVIGNLFTNYSKIVVVKSSSIGVLEHDLYTWKVLGKELETVNELDQKTKDFCDFANQVLEQIPTEKKRNIVQFFYEIFTSLGVDNVDTFLKKIEKNTFLQKKYNISLEDMQIVLKLLPMILEIFQKLH